MENTSPSQEDIKKRREFAYRAFSPDSEPPSPLQDGKNQNRKSETSGEPKDPENKSATRDNGRQNA